MQHHATLYIGSSLAAVDLPEDAVAPGNDVFHEVFADMLTVADARRLQQMATRTPVERPDLVLVIYAARIGTEAQNALLKLFEDPPGRTRFLLVVPTVTMLLPTVRSRLQLESSLVHSTALSAEGSAFLRATYKERFATIEKLHKAKDRDAMRTLITDIGTFATQHTVSPECLQAVTTALEYRDFPGASLKMWLEYLAQTLPIEIDLEEVVH